MLQYHLKCLLACLILVTASYYAGSYFGKSEVKTVTKVEKRERVRTIIKERPDGTKETVIVRDTLFRGEKEHSEKPIDPNWLVTASAGLSRGFKGEPIYGIGVSKRIVLGAYAGLYGRTDGEIGVSLSYSF